MICTSLVWPGLENSASFQHDECLEFMFIEYPPSCHIYPPASHIATMIIPSQALVPKYSATRVRADILSEAISNTQTCKLRAEYTQY